ncbi:hypothetical protein CAPTEDRAFT_213630 [Capitella teleta]|uniref:G-protein coupled receptors family 1 profile domain-containing protein n=1 Tax=Capitella teleta TaxID=283909 RepID=R7VK23_CAPTE|nr:hypothetical protein CAPTEDRAFT_213630 [Capitella teleta]|eukprot:ELU16410.1 hypothetical protein CAPTEDRAFT_213630 [Capitella teleta]
MDIDMNTTMETSVGIIDMSTLAPKKDDRGMNLDLVKDTHFYSMAIIIPIGLICNTLSIGVFAASPALRRTTTGHFLIALSAADFCFLFGELLRWMNNQPGSHQFPGPNFANEHWFWCKFMHSLRYSSKLASAWVTVAITLERFITIRFPLQVATISRPTRARFLIALIAMAACLLCVYPFWTVGLKDWQSKLYCLITNRKVYENWSMVVLRFGTLVIPSICIIILTSLIICNLQKAHTRRCHYQEGQQVPTSIQRQLTFMLLAVAISFVILRLPNAIAYYFNHYKRNMWPSLTMLNSNRIFVAYKVTDIIATTNYCLNFFLYCVCGSVFRRQVAVCCRCGGNNRRLGYAHNRYPSQQRTRTSLMVSTDSSRSPVLQRYNSYKMGIVKSKTKDSTRMLPQSSKA